MNHAPEPTIIKPFGEPDFERIRRHVREVRNCFDWPGMPYHDIAAPPEDKFNRWYWHNLPMLKELHHSPRLIATVSELFQRPLKPSYVFLSMYGPEGVCPPHTDRPQCQFTVDLQISSNAQWPINISGKDYVLEDGEAICYSGTGQHHFRKPWSETGVATRMDTPFFMNLAFFHFVPTDWMGKTE